MEVLAKQKTRKRTKFSGGMSAPANMETLTLSYFSTQFKKDYKSLHTLDN